MLFETVSEGDYFLCYILKLKRFVAVQEVISEAYVDDTPIWQDELFPYRVKVRTILKLDPETAVPVIELADRLSIFKDLKISSGWGLYFQRSPRRWMIEDGKNVVLAVEAAVKSPVKRPFDPENFNGAGGRCEIGCGNGTERMIAGIQFFDALAEGK